jgi:hypothetical protein
MERLKLDHADDAVQQFARRLRVNSEGWELELGGRVLFRIIPPGQLSEEEKANLLEEGRELVRRARARNRDVSSAVLEREVRQAVKRVRGQE